MWNLEGPRKLEATRVVAVLDLRSESDAMGEKRQEKIGTGSEAQGGSVLGLCEVRIEKFRVGILGV